jgi:hypothetical protein
MTKNIIYSTIENKYILHSSGGDGQSDKLLGRERNRKFLFNQKSDHITEEFSRIYEIAKLLQRHFLGF